MNYVEKHVHNGLDSPPINLSESTIQKESSVPTHNAKEGTMILYHSGTTYRLYIMVNKTWKYASLT